MEYQFESVGPVIRLVVLVFLIVSALVALGLVVLLAALPGRIARARRHPQAPAINVCGWLGLPSGILWVLAMVWAYVDSSNCSLNNNSNDLSELKEQVIALEQAVAELESASAKEST